MNQLELRTNFWKKMKILMNWKNKIEPILHKVSIIQKRTRHIPAGNTTHIPGGLTCTEPALTALYTTSILCAVVCLCVCCVLRSPPLQQAKTSHSNNYSLPYKKRTICIQNDSLSFLNRWKETLADLNNPCSCVPCRPASCRLCGRPSSCGPCPCHASACDHYGPCPCRCGPST